MKNKLILIEGIPGSGKTTIARKVKDYLADKGIAVKLYNEGDAHPADMAWNAYVSLDEYNKLIVKYPEYSDEIKENTSFEEDYAIVAYTKLGLASNEDDLMRYFEAHEVYDGRVSLDTFKKLHIKRWKQFVQGKDEASVAVFECSYLQNHISELMGIYNMDFDFILDYMLELIATAYELKPKLIYLSQPDTRETIKRVAEERISPDKSKYPDWIDMVIEYVEKSAYAKHHNLRGFDGAVAFFDARKKIELAVIDKLPIDKAIIRNSDYNWDEVIKQVIGQIDYK